MSDQWLQILTIIIANFGIIWWFRKECRDDWKMCDSKIEKMSQDFKHFREIWMQESKDFHERLLKIEMERNK